MHIPALNMLSSKLQNKMTRITFEFYAEIATIYCTCMINCCLFILLLPLFQKCRDFNLFFLLLVSQQLFATKICSFILFSLFFVRHKFYFDLLYCHIELKIFTAKQLPCECCCCYYCRLGCYLHQRPYR